MENMHRQRLKRKPKSLRSTRFTPRLNQKRPSLPHTSVVPSLGQSPSGKGVLKKKKKSKKTYVAMFLVSFEINYDEEAGKAKNKG